MMKIGDCVRRIKNGHYGCPLGTIWKIQQVFDNNDDIVPLPTLRLYGLLGEQDARNFRLIQPKQETTVMNQPDQENKISGLIEQFLVQDQSTHQDCNLRWV